MTIENWQTHISAAQNMIQLLNQELVAANNEFIALTLELEAKVDQLKQINQRLAQEIAERRQVEIALQTREQEVRQLNQTLEQQIQQRTTQLQQAFEFEASLKRITDKVRDSLDEAQILQTAVEELSRAIPGSSCNASLYDLEQQTAVIQYEYTRSRCIYRGRSLNITSYPELYSQIIHGQTFQFCSLTPNTERGQVTVLAQPILDDRRVLGDIWVTNHHEYCFSEQDVRLVQQVANQCAIALRQSQLYQSSQAQVRELERLNQLKDDFLSTVSHELRAPMANIKMSSHLLSLHLQPLIANHASSASRYLQVLQSECDREISLINDLLDLARVDAMSDPLELVTVDLQQHLARLLTSFQERTQQQQQQLQIEIPDQLSTFKTHLEYFDRILTELLHNACKYTPSGGCITLSAALLPPVDRAHLNLIRNAEFVLIRITNTGVEIPREECDRIFEKFYRIPNNDPWRHGGTGLGLALVKKLTERLGASIRVESQNNQTTFIVTFPTNSITDE